MTPTTILTITTALTAAWLSANGLILAVMVGVYARNEKRESRTSG